jgi:nucleolar GTP-binding protein
MVRYNFKKIGAVPSSTDFVNIVLSKTQRKTPTMVHKGYKISRIRSFYMRKIRFTQGNFSEKLRQIILEFPKLDEIHPFYAALINVLYDRDHYKLALGQINTALHLIEKVGKDYLRLLKFGDTLYRCKTLKRGALGRMCTIMKKQKPSLEYLEQVRQHLARLPNIDPNTRTIIIAGYPNVGKSSFINKVTRADVDVQPYAFTTKSLFVGHTDYKYLQFQVIDTPGVLDHPLQDMNTIEMQSITALAHIRAAILFFIDISEQCGFTIVQQVELFNNIKPLFTNKPLIIALNKIDVRRPEDLPQADKDLLQGLVTGDVDMLAMSTKSDEGVADLKNTACEKLLQMRVEEKLAGHKVDSIKNRMHIAQPKTGEHELAIPEAALARIAAKKAGELDKEYKTERDLEREGGGPGIYDVDLRKRWLLANEEHRYDVIPEIMDGHNISDYIDPDIMKQLDLLDAEEEARMAAMENEIEEEEMLDEAAIVKKATAAAIKKKKTMIVNVHRRAKALASHGAAKAIPRNKKRMDASKMEATLGELGVDASQAHERVTTRARSRSRSRSVKGTPAVLDEEGRRTNPHGQRHKLPDSLTPSQKKKAEVVRKKSQKERNLFAKAGEGDRVIQTKMPKHLFSGKRGIGKTDRR